MALRYFKENGWKSTVLCVDPSYVESSPDGELLGTIDADQEIVRVKAVPYQWTRPFGFGGISWRAYGSINRVGQRLLNECRFDAVYFSSTVFRTFCLGPEWAEKYGVPYFIDYHDPWWTDYYFKAGAPNPPGGMAKYRVTQWLARKNEGRVIRGASGVTCVSAAYVTMLRERYPEVDAAKFIELPFGAPESDFEIVRQKSGNLPFRKATLRECWSYIGAGGP
ncbi:MAG: hypothetical protein EBS53_19010, partial [Bacteroidetes bacterium]|nr:hypothetical protein [Bacteroidota bacterium]